MEKFIVLDTETANDIDCPLCYDMGWILTDRTGTVYESYSYVISDIFLDKGLMSSAYYAEKIPQYQADLNSGSRKLARFLTVKKIFNDCCKRNNVTKIFAHNARFDYKSLQTTLRYITTSKMRFFFPYGVEIWDTLKMSRAVFKDDENYGEFCYRNDFLTKRGCRKYTAEVLYRFLTDNVTFIEEHKGLDDVMIEKEIMSECFKRVTDLDGRLWAD